MPGISPERLRYKPEIVNEIIRRISEGEPLEHICRDEHMPEAEVVHRWRVQHPEFAERYDEVRRRPRQYEPGVVDDLCRRLAGGETMTAICSDEHMPSLSTVQSWRRQYPEFLERYEAARREQAETFVDHAVDLADEMKGADSGAAVAAARLRADQRMKLASKFAPDRFGERIEVNASINITAQHLHAVMELSQVERAVDSPRLPANSPSRRTLEQSIIDVESVPVDISED